jgi:hypothetical protein
MAISVRAGGAFHEGGGHTDDGEHDHELGAGHPDEAAAFRRGCDLLAQARNGEAVVVGAERE